VMAIVLSSFPGQPSEYLTFSDCLERAKQIAALTFIPIVGNFIASLVLYDWLGSYWNWISFKIKLGLADLAALILTGAILLGILGIFGRIS
jgi:hypothetical protein